MVVFFPVFFGYSDLQLLMQMVLDALRVVMEPAKPGCEVSVGRQAVLVEAGSVDVCSVGQAQVYFKTLARAVSIEICCR